MEEMKKMMTTDAEFLEFIKALKLYKEEHPDIKITREECIKAYLKIKNKKEV